MSLVDKIKSAPTLRKPGHRLHSKPHFRPQTAPLNAMNILPSKNKYVILHPLSRDGSI